MRPEIHIISDNNYLDSLYDLNIRIYVDEEANFLSNKESIKAELERNLMTPRIFLAREELVLKYYQDIQKVIGIGKDKVFVIGEIDSAINFSKVFKNRFDVRSIIRAIAHEIEVTAKEMSKKEVPHYFPISKSIFDYLDKASCNVFYTRDGEYIKLYAKNSAITKMHEELDDEVLYIPALERLDFINKASMLVIEELKNQKLTAPEKIEILAQGAKFVAEEIYDNEKVNEQIVNISNECLKALEQVSGGVPKAKNLIAMLLDNKEGFLYTHSIFSTYIAKEIISHMPWGSKEQQEKVSFVLFFHDLFLVPIYAKYDNVIDEEDLLFRDDVSQEDKEIIFDHAAMASNFIRSFPRAPMGADTLIAQHHGSISGKGFPGVFGDDISPLAKVIVIAHEVSKHVFESLEQKDAKLAFDKGIILEKLHEKFQRVTYRKIIDSFTKVEL